MTVIKINAITVPADSGDKLGKRFPVTLAAAGAVIRRPDLWLTALRAAKSLAPDRWWRQAPHLPIPDPEWLRFRLVTAYGGDGSRPMGGDELVTWLEWKRALVLDHG